MLCRVTLSLRHRCHSVSGCDIHLYKKLKNSHLHQILFSSAKNIPVTIVTDAVGEYFKLHKSDLFWAVVLHFLRVEMVHFLSITCVKCDIRQQYL